ncbi:MAG: NAD(P)-binding protein [Lachnospiraceae bacterium]|nr:NAD(P)-binding protein [Lachnospiraceae bacterium]
MIRIHQLKGAVDASEKELLRKAAALLKINDSDMESFRIVKQSIDARKKPDIIISYVVEVTLKRKDKAWEERLVKKLKNPNISVAERKEYVFPKPGDKKLTHRPVIVGMGPAGLFCGYFLAKHGYSPLILERGKDVDARTRDVEHFWETGELKPASNVQFGEGGAGTFSDGKLNTLVKDVDGRSYQVMRTFVHHGAPEKILYDYKPHIGTDVLREVVKSMREEIIRLGGEVRFEAKVSGFDFEGNQVCGLVLENGERITTSLCVLAIGHSARDTFEELYRMQVPMEAKSFAVGFRVEHPQEMINESQYGKKDAGSLGAAPYKVTAKTSTGRGVYSFCMCPGGYVVNASSEEGRLCVNGMSYSGRDSKNANSAIIVAVTPADFGSDHPLAGVEFQRRLEEHAYKAGGGKIPMQRFGAFRATVTGENLPEMTQEDNLQPLTKGAYQEADLTGILPMECNQAFVEGMEHFGHIIKGFDRPDATMLGVESRTSSSVRIHRDESLQSLIRGLYPCGEGAGYAGGITSAAMDGMRIAEEIAKEYAPLTH